MPRWPFPIGENKSIIRVEIELPFSASLNFSEGKPVSNIQKKHDLSLPVGRDR
jgi:hypothetical protein